MYLFSAKEHLVEDVDGILHERLPGDVALCSRAMGRELALMPSISDGKHNVCRECRRLTLGTDEDNRQINIYTEQVWEWVD